MDTQAKANADAISQEVTDRNNAINTAKTELAESITTLSGNAVQYDADDKGLITLGGGATGTTISNVKAGTLSATSTEAVNGSQLFATNTQVSLNAASISGLKSNLGTMTQDIETNRSSISSLKTSISTINSNVTKATTQLTKMLSSSADISLSNLNDDGKAVLSDAAKAAVQDYIKSNNIQTTSLAKAASIQPASVSAISVASISPASAGETIAYDDSTKSKITLGVNSAGTFTTNTEIQGVAGGQVYEGSNYVATGDDVYKVKKSVNSFSDTIDLINTNISDINSVMAEHTSLIGEASQIAKSNQTKLNRGYVVQINGITVRTATPNDNAINFTSGENTTLSDNNGSISVSVNGDGEIAKGDTGLITGDTAKVALDKKADTDLNNISDEAKKNIQKAVSTDLSGKADVDLGNLSAEGQQKIKDVLATDMSNKASTDASNINTSKYAEKLGTGIVTEGDTNLVTGGTVFEAIKEIQGGDAGLLSKVDLSLKNISEDGETKIKTLAQNAVTVDDGTYTTVSTTTDANGNLTYHVNVTADGTIAEGSTGLITGDTAKKALDKKADADLGNLSAEGKKVIQDAVSVDLSAKANADASNIAQYAENWATAIGTGKVEKGSNKLVTGDVVYSAVSVKADKSYVDTELAKKADLSDVTDKLATKADADLGNLSDAGKDKIKEVLKDDLNQKADKSYVDTELAKKVDQSDFNTVKDQVDQNTKDLASKADKSYVDTELSKKADADNVYTKEEADKKIESIKDNLVTDWDNKVNADGSNIDIEKWQEVLSDGKDEAGNKGLINGDTLHNALNDLKKDGIGLVQQDGDTITVAKDSETTKVNFSGTDKDGNTVNRVLTGITTDENDSTSAANVGYVSGVASELESRMDSMGSQLTKDIKEAGAVASALAGLHHIDYDPDNKLDFAVATAGYRGKSAAALGAFYQPNENIMFSLGGTIGSTHNAWNLGVSFKLGHGSDSPVLSRRVLGNRVNALAAQNKELAARNEQLEQDVQDMKNKLNLLLKSATLAQDVQKSIVK